MGFKFSFLCDLLSGLEENRTAKAASGTLQSDFRTIREWFASHDRHINLDDTDRVALLSCMFPEKRTDRVFWLQATSLARVIGRCLCLGSSRLAELGQWQKQGGPDLGRCVENVMRQTENYIPEGREVTTEEIDMALGMIASRCRFSGPNVRRQQTAVDVDSLLFPLYRRLSSRDAKWLTRMILKSYAPVTIPSKHALGRFHFLLPHLLQFQDTFEGALQMLNTEPIKSFPPHPNPKLAAGLCSKALEHLQPRTGIKIGRPEYFKARSVKHCHNMANGRRMSLERKYDGEYCQIHVNLMDIENPVRIFSKSGKDSTDDRSGIFPTLEESLQMGSDQCRFSRRCILEGELVVWSEKRGGIADFHKLRKFLTRSGTMIGIDSDSPPQPYEHLMIVFFDILVLDDDICLSKPHRQRRLLLKDTVKTIHGRAELSEQEIIDSSRLGSLDQLEVSFAKAIAQCWEGYVLKACGEPYFPIYAAGTNATFGRWIKLKKDYIQGLGDTVDLALIGAYYDAGDAANLPSLRRLKWTHFLVGCLLNKDSVLELGESPRFRIIDAVNRHCMHIDRLKVLNQHGEFSACEPDEFNTFAVEYGRKELSKACVLFKKPFVVELMGSGFEKPPGARYYALRFPRILKIYTDRTFEDAVSFQELQLLADDARSVPTEDLNDEVGQWCKRLKVGDGLKQYIIPRSRSLPSTCSSDSDTEMESDSTDSRATSQCSKGGEKPETKTPQIHHQISEQLDRSQPDGSTSGIPVVYLDDTDSSLSPGSPSHYKRISTQNSQTPHRRPLIEIEPGNRTGEKRDPYASDISQTKTKIAASNPRKDRRVSVPCERHTQPVNISQAPDESPLPFKPQHVLQSLLTTVPVYMSGQRAGRHMSSLSSRSHLHEFIKTLISPDAIVSLKRSNPRAEREALSFGIFLVNPSESSLGKEIHGMVDAIREISYPRNPRAPNKCNILFLNSAILERELLPEDLRFFDQETWCGLGRQYYYACLEWDLNGSVKDLGVAATSAIANREFNNSIKHALPALSVNFDESQILALGEYVLDRADDQMK